MSVAILYRFPFKAFIPYSLKYKIVRKKLSLLSFVHTARKENVKSKMCFLGTKFSVRAIGLVIILETAKGVN